MGGGDGRGAVLADTSQAGADGTGEASAHPGAPPAARQAPPEAELWCGMYYALAGRVVRAGYFIAYPEGMGGEPVLVPRAAAP